MLRDPIEPTNTQIVERPAAVGGTPAGAVRTLPPGLRATALSAAGRLEPRLRGGSVYTDDKALVEWLIDKSILDYAAD